MKIETTATGGSTWATLADDATGDHPLDFVPTLSRQQQVEPLVRATTPYLGPGYNAAWQLAIRVIKTHADQKTAREYLVSQATALAAAVDIKVTHGATTTSKWTNCILTSYTPSLENVTTVISYQFSCASAATS